MILLITSAPKAQDCITALEQATGERVQLAATLLAATRLLRNEPYSALVMDEFLLQADPQEAEVALEAGNAATAVFVNFAIVNPDRLVRDVRAALRRREKDRAVVRREVESLLRSRLNEALTGILLSTQLALTIPALPQAAEAKMRSAYELAMSMRSCLDSRH